MAELYLPIDASMGERIRYYRQKAGMTQKALAEYCEISEPAIRNYELGNRIPDYDTLCDISQALEVSYYSLADPQINALFGSLHTFFLMEQIYGIHPEMQDGKVSIVFDENADSLMTAAVKVWATQYKKCMDGQLTREEYELWKSKYPDFANAAGELVEPEPVIIRSVDIPQPKRRRRKK